MNKHIIIILTVFLFYIQNIYAQIIFLGFDQQECDTFSDYGYSTQITTCDPNSTNGYAIYKDSVKVYSNCIYAIPIKMQKLMMYNDSSGFLVEDMIFVFNIYATESSWSDNYFYGGAYAGSWLGFFMVSPNCGFLITTKNNKVQISRVSDINSESHNYALDATEIITQETVYGELYCELDTLSFKVKRGNDTTHFKMALNQVASIEDKQDLVIGISPNPVTSFFGFNNGVDYEQIDKINIYDFSGRKISLLDPSSSNRYYVGNLKNGLYFVELLFDNKKKVFKMIKI